ncbi:MAG: hypothetical protein KAR42_15265 [candidate division Zixibacteria bacterium]|nr:hypothetical protein [candidate division Zixibacteria bacterium]
MTKAEYIQNCPKSYLARNLAKNSWPDSAVILIIGGLVAPQTKQSNLYGALQRSKTKQYCVGGHRYRGTEGFWIAVY